MKSGYMLNLKTLKCLEADGRITGKLSLNYCCGSSMQKWILKSLPDGSTGVENTKLPGYYHRWIRESKSNFFYNNVGDDSAYHGCYRYSGNRYMRVVFKSKRERSLKLGVNAPIFLKPGHEYCRIDVTSSTYSFDGHVWEALHFNSTRYSVDYQKYQKKYVLTIKNTYLFLDKWPGALIRLGLKCNSTTTIENQCILLKIEGSSKKLDARRKVISPRITSPTMASRSLTTKDSRTFTTLESTSIAIKDILPRTTMPMTEILALTTKESKTTISQLPSTSVANKDIQSGTTLSMTATVALSRKDSSTFTTLASTSTKGMSSSSINVETVVISVFICFLATILSVVAFGMIKSYVRRERTQRNEATLENAHQTDHIQNGTNESEQNNSSSADESTDEQYCDVLASPEVLYEIPLTDYFQPLDANREDLEPEHIYEGLNDGSEENHPTTFQTDSPSISTKHYLNYVIQPDD